MKRCILGIAILSLAGCSQPFLKRVEYSLVLNNPAISFSFPDSKTDLQLATLAQETKLGQLLAGKVTDYDRIKTLTNYVHHLFPHNGSNTPSRDDPLTIFREAKQGGKSFRCVEYSYLLAGMIQSAGLSARVLALKMKGADTIKSGAGHVVTEAFLPQFSKWVMIDGQMNTILEYNGTPLNTAEIRLFSQDGRNLSFSSLESIYSNVQDYLLDWLLPYLFYLDTEISADLFIEKPRYERERVMLIPLGAPRIALFQRETPLRIVNYTSSVPSFYPEITP